MAALKSIVLMILPFSLYGAIPGNYPIAQLKKYEKNVANLKREISSLEKQLGNSNKRYVAILEKRKSIDGMIGKQKNDLKKNLNDIEKNSIHIKKLMQSLVLYSIGSGEKSSGEILSRDLLKKSLNLKLKQLWEGKQKNKELNNQITQLQQRYEEYLDIEEGILNLIKDWEYYKKEKTQDYALQSKKLRNIKNWRKTSKPVVKNFFDNPIERYSNIKHGKKGVTYYTHGYQKIKNSRPGRVVYNNKLSTFGNVIMVDHGDNFRSIFLGQFIPKLKKGSNVKKGDILGYTDGGKKKMAKIYFEIRKKNKAQNTIRFINKDSLAKAKVGHVGQKL